MKIFFSLLVLSFSFLTIQAQNFALNFDGDNDEVRLTNEAGFLIGSDYTIEAWINASEWRDEQWQGSIVCTDKQGPDEGYAFRCGKSGTLSFVMSVNNNWNEVATGPIMDQNIWNHVAVVITNGSMSLFVNGEEKATKSYSGNFTGNLLARLKVGASSEFPGRVFNGAIDEVRIWNIARTGQELFDNSSIELTGNEPGLIAYLPFNEGTGFSTANLVNDANPGVLQNMMEDDWVSGVSLSGVDLGVTDIVNPNLIDLFKRPVEVSAVIKNFGNEDISTFDMQLLLNGDVIHSETVDVQIESGDKVSLTLNHFIDVGEMDQVNLEVKTIHPNDANSLNDSKSLYYKKPNSSVVRLFDQKTHNFGSAGQTHNKTVILPTDLQDFEQILLHIDLSCPSGGCDPWDQPANISIINNGQEYEIARYITPYGKSCGPWVVDITDFKSILGGLSTFKSYIQVWGGSGWNLTLDLELIDQESESTYHKFTPLWQTDYLVYGDPGISDDLDQKSIIIEDETESAHVRMTISGHGQGNTNNAAEFSPMTHRFTVGELPVQDHYLWKTDCAANPCSNQAGTWELSRAGWCPGQAVQPFVVNMTDQLTPGFLVRLDYELASYTNLLNTGYNGGSHTEPHYRIHSFLIEASSERYGNYRNLIATDLMVPVDESMMPVEPIEFTFVNNGTVLVNNPRVQYYVNGNLIQEDIVQATIQPGESHTHNFINVDGFVSGENSIVAHIDYDNDQNIGDDFVKAELFGIVSSEDVFLAEQLKIYPNPSEGIFNIEITSELGLVRMEILDATGKVILDRLVDSNVFQVTLDETSVYLIKFTDTQGRVFTRRLIIKK